MQKPSQRLHVAIEAARIGAGVGMSYFDTGIASTLKEDQTVLTVADTESEEAIKTYILSQYSDAKFVGEETGGSSDEEAFWVIDPIDGTRSFSRGIDTWCVLIAYYEKGESVVGVCYFPVLNQLLTGEKGKGAFLNDKKVHVSNISDMKLSLGAFGSIRHFKDRNVIFRLTDACGATRGPDTTYSAFLTTCGKMDILIDNYGNFWDVAPFLCIAPEAGGKVTNLEGTQWTPKDRGYIITNGIFHDKAVAIVSGKV